MITPERRRAITLAMVDPERSREVRSSVITFVRKVGRCANLIEFFDRGNDADVRHVEGLLGL